MAVSRIHASGLLARTFLALTFLVLCTSLGIAASNESRLSPRHRAWLDKDVVYIISRDEKDAFLGLPDDSARDTFIERFWEVRNPTPGAPSNPYKDEHYRRIEYANQYFGHETGTPGWKTDMGRVYIQLGEPQQKALYLGYNKLRPMQIWFYQNSNQALPPFFYVVFYRADLSADFKIYSPYVDGPEKLVTTEPGNRAESLKVIQQQAGNEVARTALSLLPDEPVDMNIARPSLLSDVMLATLRNLPNNEFTKREIDRRRELLESVTHSVILGGEFLDASVVPLRDSEGNLRLDYVLRQQRPEDFGVGQAKDGRFYYSIEITAQVLTADGKPVFSQKQQHSEYLNEAQFARIKHESLAYEGTLPISPGRYKLDFVLSNILTRTNFRVQKEIEVPDPGAQKIELSPIVAFGDSEMAGSRASASSPFSVAGVKFYPLVGKQLDLASGRDLKFFYQIWAPVVDPASHSDKNLLVEYGYGRPGVPGDSKVIRENVGRAQFDSVGSLVNGKKIPLADAPAGNYRLVVTVTDPETQQRSFASMTFRIVSDPAATDTWYTSQDDSELSRDLEEYDRALCYLASGNTNNAVAWLRRSFERNHSNQRVWGTLVDLYFQKQSFAEIAALYPQVSISTETEDRTLLEIADSLDKGGNLERAAQLLEGALRVKPPSAQLYLKLASYYRRMGDPNRAQELERRTESLRTSPSS
jgi:GWxTD domain-containing protein